MCREDALKVREDNRKLEQERNRLQAASVSRLKAFEAEIGCMCMRERKSARACARTSERERERGFKQPSSQDSKPSRPR